MSNNFLKIKEQNNISRRKVEIEERIMRSRLKQDKNINMKEVEQEVKEVEEVKDVKNPNYQKTKWPRANPVKCWNCHERGHRKDLCPERQCYYCNKFGHVKTKCIVFLLTKLIHQQSTKKTAKKEAPVPNIEQRLKNVHSIPQGRNITIYDRKWRLGTYMGPEKDTSGLTKTYGIPEDKLEIKVNKSIRASKIKDEISPLLNCQCQCNGQVYRGDKFIEHSMSTHGGFILRNSAYNLLRIRNEVLWDDELDYFRLVYDEGIKFWEEYINFE